MRKIWIHPEYRIALQANKAGCIPVSQMLIELTDVFSNRESASKHSHSTFNRLVMSFLMIACCLSLLVAEMVFGKSKDLMFAVARFEDPFIGFSPARLNGVADKQIFLARLSAEQRGEIAGNTHYIAEMMSSSSSKVADADKKLALAIVLESVKADVDPLLVAAIIKSESTFNRMAISHRGAQGLMQLLPETGRYISSKSDLVWTGSHRLNDPEYNVRLGIAYLKYLKKSFGGNLEHALIAYNWGPGKLQTTLKQGGKIPRSPVTYAQKIMTTHEQWRRDLDNRMASYKFLNLDSMVS